MKPSESTGHSQWMEEATKESGSFQKYRKTGRGVTLMILNHDKLTDKEYNHKQGQQKWGSDNKHTGKWLS